jgi:hypothetical protein
MTNSEKIIFELFSDLKGITGYMDDFDNLKKFYNQAVSLFNKGKYSDINIQDDEGNTMLHYAMKADNFEWSEKILRKGANPFIKNNDNKNCFFMFREYGGAYTFSEKFKDIYLDDGFPQKTLGFSKEYKQSLLEDRAKKSQMFKSIDEIHDFLSKANLLSVENTSRLLSQSISIKMDDKLSSYMKHYDGAENNTFFFRHIAHDCANRFVFKNKNLETEFFDREFVDNALFVEGVCMLGLAINDFDYLKDTMRTIINVMFTREFDMTRPTGAKNESIEDFLNEREFIKTIFIKEKLDFVLQKDSYSKVNKPKKI